MALSTVSEVEKVLGVDLSTADETNVTNVFIPAADAAIENFVGYALEYQASISETFDGDDSEDLFLKRLPIVSVASVVEDGVTLTAGNDNDYVIYNSLGLIRRTGLQFWSAQKLQNIVVTYAAGYSDSEATAEDIPKDIKFVSARIAGRLYTASAALSTQQSTGTVSTNVADNTTDSQFQLVKSERLGDYQTEYESVLGQMNQEILNESDKQVLSKYKKQYFTSAGLLD
tara:strand:- start:610 stop:1296 length:687 start_codon:yes stop_codon:yes gene_type:complete